MSKSETPDPSWSLDRLAAHVVKHGKASTADCWHVGAACNAAKAGHKGEFVAWMKKTIGKVSTVYRYMKLAQRPLAEVQNLPLWEVTCPVKSTAKGKTPARYLGEVKSVLALVESGALREWSSKDREKFLASVGVLYNVLGDVLGVTMPSTVIGGARIDATTPMQFQTVS